MTTPRRWARHVVHRKALEIRQSLELALDVEASREALAGLEAGVAREPAF